MVVDVRSPGFLRRTRQISGNQVEKLDIHNDALYLACRDYGLRVVNLNDYSYQGGRAVSGGCRDLKVTGSELLLVGGDNRLRILKQPDLATLAAVTTPADTAGVLVKGNYLCLWDITAYPQNA